MRNKGIIRTFAILMALVCVYQLLFTWKTWSVEKEAKRFADGDYRKEAKYLDSISTMPVYNFIGLRKYSYKECKEREINLGLDLKGGMNVILEVSVSDVLLALSNYNPDPTFRQALSRAAQLQINSQDDFINLFGRAFREIDPNAQLAAIFRTVELGNKISFNASNDDVIRVLHSEAKSAIDNAFNIIRTRIDRFGVVQPNVQQLETNGRILVELPGVKEPERVLKLLQGSANLEFWETYENSEVYPFMEQANVKIREIEAALKGELPDTAATTSVAVETPTPPVTAEQTDTTAGSGILEQLKQETTASADSVLLQDDRMANNPLFAVMQIAAFQGQLMSGSTVGMASVKDTGKVNRYLAMPQVRDIFPRDMRFLWSVKPMKEGGRETDLFELHAIKMTGRDGRPPLGGDVITNASGEFSQRGGSSAEVSMSMNSEGAAVWARLTKDNIGRCIAIVLDDNVYSAPRVQVEITGGRSQITGNFDINEATDLANILKSGKLPARTKVIQNEVVGPTLGKESIRSGFVSFAMALIVVFIFLAFYYNKAGAIADIALIVNMFFLMGVLSSLGSVLTLPGIAGIVLTLGMANDANIIIFERIREELRAGKGIRLAVSDGYKNALSAIIDGNVTTFLTGVVLFFFGTGPIQGFATTLTLGILTSLFCAIFITRLIFEWALKRNMDIKFSIPATESVLKDTKINFIGVRKKAYIISLSVIVIGIGSMLVQGFNYGIDFTGGRSYTIRFAEPVNTVELQSSLRRAFDDNMPEVKTIGADNQVKVVSSYLMDEEDNAEFKQDIDSIIEARLFEGSKYLLPEGTTIEEFKDPETIVSRQKVGASIAGDIKRNAYIAVFLSLVVMFLYIFLRFRNWQFGVAAVISQFHDSIIMISLYSLLWKIVPFSLDVDQQFIAAILTIIGYSINDTVIIFDRIREWTGLYPKRPVAELYNSAINSTLSRTMNTSLTTGFVLLLICIFGGEILRGFAFAMLIGVAVGTYSSVFTAAPIVFDLITRKKATVVKAK
jgi:SecD/SecF fusion protein